MNIKTIIFDGDGTVWHYPNVNHFGSSWDAISLALGHYERVQELLEYYYPKPNLYSEWVREQAALFKGDSVTRAEKAMYPVPYTKGFVDFINHARGRFSLGLLTTGLDIPAKRVEHDLNLDFCFCNTLCTRNGRFTGEATEDVPLWEKLKVLRNFLKATGRNAEEVCYVGDSKGDIPCLREVGLGVLFRPKERLKLRRVIQDHRELIGLLTK